MARRTSPSDAEHIVVADDLQAIVHDKREGWRASAAKARRRQRRYKRLLTRQLMKTGPDPGDDDIDGEAAFPDEDCVAMLPKHRKHSIS